MHTNLLSSILCNHVFFQALREIAKAARVESRAMFAEATRQADEVTVTLEGEVDVHSEAGQMIIEQLITEIQDRERRRKSVASVGTSCLQACAPLLASRDIQTCLLALGVIEVSQNVTQHWKMMTESKKPFSFSFFPATNE